MFTLSNLAVLALAGTTIAAPALQERGWQGGWGGWRQGGWSHGSGDLTATVYDVATATVTMTGTPPATDVPSAPFIPEAPAPAAAEATPTPAASAGAFYGGGNGWGSSAPSTPAPSSGAPVSNDGSWQSVVATWRAAAGLPALSPDSTLEANALKTATDGNGQMKHELNPGTMGQVLAPGGASDFESVYVGGWLCEVPGGAGLNGICSSMAQGWDHSDGETGHADILSSTSYTKIGCALATGIWACDLA